LSAINGIYIGKVVGYVANYPYYTGPHIHMEIGGWGSGTTSVYQYVAQGTTAVYQYNTIYNGCGV